MTTEQKPPAKPPAARPAPHVEMKLKSFPVDYIKAKPQADFDVPGKIGSAITTNPERPANRAYHWVEYVPEMRSFSVTCVSPNEGERTVYVPDSNVRSWAPLR